MIAVLVLLCALPLILASWDDVMRHFAVDIDLGTGREPPPHWIQWGRLLRYEDAVYDDGGPEFVKRRRHVLTYQSAERYIRVRLPSMEYLDRPLDFGRRAQVGWFYRVIIWRERYGWETWHDPVPGMTWPRWG